MKKQLLTVGDSFTYGDELEDQTQAWPTQLAARLDYELLNLGKSGASNAAILRRTLESLVQAPADLIVIGWTSPGRIEWKDQVGVAYSLWPGFAADTQYITDHPWRADWLRYINQYHSPEYLYEQYLIQVISLQSYCQAHSIDYRFLNIRQDDYYHRVGQEQHSGLAGLIDCTKFIGWNAEGMQDIARPHLMPRGHPDPQGHLLITEKILNDYQEYPRP